MPYQRLLLTLAISISPVLAFGQEDVAPVVRKEGVTEELRVIVETPLTAADREHWAFRPMVRSPVPPIDVPGLANGSIDAWIFARLKQAGLVPVAEPDRATLLRRISLDLIGLPPTVGELDDFEADSRPDAYERQIDRLLASPAYGERWGQHWLDLARFAETDGFEHDKVRTDAWKFRDWVIAAFNENLPYSRFVQLQLAGDELDEPVATMFCLAGPDMPDINDQVERRHLLLNEMTSTVGAVFLGLQLGCAECHDHKYDPVSQADFYRLRATFESTLPDLKRDVPYLQLKPRTESMPARFWVRGNHRRPGPLVTATFPRIASHSDVGDVPPAGMSPRMAFAHWLARPDNPLSTRVIVNRLWKHHFGRGLFETPSDVGLLNAEPTHPELLDSLATEFQGHGGDLKWLHRQIAGSITFRQASRPHPDDANWSRRLATDPDNKLYSRGFRRRLDGESVRDAMLAMSGLLTDERGGPGVMPPLPDELVGTLLKGQWTTSPRPADHDRRSIYLFARRNLRYPIFEVFDRPDANASCAVRNRSTTPIQSLLLLNSALSLRAAQHLADQVMAASTNPSQQIDNLFRRVFSRHPTSAELQQFQQFIAAESVRLRQEQRMPDQLALPSGVVEFSDPCQAATLVQACLAVLNASETLYVD